MSTTPSTASKLKTPTTTALLAKLNKDYRLIHTRYEKLFWQAYMGDHSIDEAFTKAQMARERFRTNTSLNAQVSTALTTATAKDAAKLVKWELF